MMMTEKTTMRKPLRAKGMVSEPEMMNHTHQTMSRSPTTHTISSFQNASPDLRRRRISMAEVPTTAAAKRMMNRTRLVSVGEEKAWVLSRKRSHHSEQATYRKVARHEPEMEPIPPMTTMSRIS